MTNTLGDSIYDTLKDMLTILMVKRQRIHDIMASPEFQNFPMSLQTSALDADRAARQLLEDLQRGLDDINEEWATVRRELLEASATDLTVEQRNALERCAEVLRGTSDDRTGQGTREQTAQDSKQDELAVMPKSGAYPAH